MPELEIRELTDAERSCLQCTLIAPQCTGKEHGCVFAQITRSAPVVSSGKNLTGWRSPESRAKAVANASVTRRLNAGWIKEAGQWVAKPCTACKEVLPLDAFYRHKTTGFPSGQCKPCHKLTMKLSYKGTTRREVMDAVRELRTAV